MIAQPKILGVVVNEAQFWREGKLLKAQEKGMARLKELVYKEDPDLYVFNSMIELSTSIGFSHGTKGVLPAVDPQLRGHHFLQVALEFRRRIGV